MVCRGGVEWNRALDSLEFEFQGVLSLQVWVLRTKPQSSARAVSSLNR